jgi:hypothetical protein
MKQAKRTNNNIKTKINSNCLLQTAALNTKFACYLNNRNNKDTTPTSSSQAPLHYAHPHQHHYNDLNNANQQS